MAKWCKEYNTQCVITHNKLYNLNGKEITRKEMLWQEN